MHDNLQSIIKSHILMHGAMGVDTYWNICLLHPVHGYYIKQNPIGAAGDFTTAPEISQLFGEMVGVWVAMQLSRFNNADKIYLLECGAGRGTLMADLLRVLQKISPEFDKVSVNLIEISPILRAVQRQTLNGYDINWHDNIDLVPNDAPIIIIGNEFLDALPIKQYIRVNGALHERVIGIDDNGELNWGLKVSPELFENKDEFIEISPMRDAMMRVFCNRIKSQQGALLMIDYGHYGDGKNGNTLQAVINHRRVDVLTNYGNADITSHVDFGRLAVVTGNLNVRLCTQSEFLMAAGIEARFNQLMKNADDKQAHDLRAGFLRLTSPDEMGELFKVLDVC